MSSERGKFSLIFCDGWDHERGEAAGGGHCVGEYLSLGDAVAARAAYESSAPLMWGRGGLVITSPQHKAMLGPAALKHHGAVGEALARAMARLSEDDGDA